MHLAISLGICGTFSTADSDITELADEQQDEMEDFDDEAFVDDTGSDAGTEEGSDLFSDGHDPFYDRSPWFILVGRLVRLKRERQKGTSSCSIEAPCEIVDNFALGTSSHDVLIWLKGPEQHSQLYLSVQHTAGCEDTPRRIPYLKLPSHFF